MFRHLIALLCVFQMALAAPQFVTFKDGKVGVNFGGYHAEAGLGGLLTGNAAHGGLSASAGTPWGPQAAAGLNGALDGRAAGTAYAGAQLNPQVGASSIIGGSVGDGHNGFSGAEAHSNGKTVVKTHGVVGGAVGGEAGGVYTEGPEPEHGVQKVHVKSVQKIKPHKKYHLIKTEEIQHSNVNDNSKPSDEVHLSNNNNNNNENYNDANISTVDSNHDAATVAVSSVNGSSSNFTPRTTTTTTAAAVSSAAADAPAEELKIAELITVNRQRHRERKHKLKQERRRLAQTKRRTHNLHRTKVITSSTSHAVEPNGVALSTPSTSTTLLSTGNSGAVEETKSGDAAAHSKQVVKSVYKEIRLPSGSTLASQDNLATSPQHAQHPHHQAAASASSGYESGTVGFHANTGLVGNVLNIPIGILRSLQESLSGVDINKSVSYTKLA